MPSHADSTHRSKSSWVKIALVFGIVAATVLGLVAYQRLGTGKLADRLVQEARTEFERGDFKAAAETASRALERDPDQSEANLIRGRALKSLGKHREALEAYSAIPDDHGRRSVIARNEAGDIALLELRDIPAALDLFQRAWRQAPDDPTANNRLAYLVGLGEGGWAAIPFRIEMIRSEAFTPVQLWAIAKTAPVIEETQVLEKYLESTPGDPNVLTAFARRLIEENRREEAIATLRAAIDADPNMIGAQLELGRLLLERQDDAEFVRWHSSLSVEADDHPLTWRLRAEFIERHNDMPAAARCYWEAVRLDGNDSVSLYRLGQLLAALNRRDEAIPFLNRAQRLEKYITTTDSTTRQITLASRDAAVQAESLGLLWEAYGWSQWVMRETPTAEWASLMSRRIQPRLRRLGNARSFAKDNPAKQISLGNLPLPDWARIRSEIGRTPSISEADRRIRFDDRARNTGLDFQYFNGGEPAEGMKQMYEFTGGGAAALDYDSDGWPDIYLTQGCRWPVDDKRTEHLDRLYRNIGGARFIDATHDARLMEPSFSQGIAAGDVNGDGFCDIYVGNIGPNRWFLNNGDGTFVDPLRPTVGSRDARTVQGDDWTTSCLIADLNRDALPDVYVVNYLTGDDVFTRECGHAGGRSLCLPQYFDGAQDRLLLNDARGSFNDATLAAGITATDGRGMGIVAGDFDGEGRLELFVANDMSPNFLFVDSSGSDNGVPQFEEEALLRGTASNRFGEFEACMGIAAGDADGDGLPDLFVTNFDQESNTLYRQQPGMVFVDQTRTAGLEEPSRSMLGFGAQFLDADLDGDLDLVVANGHIDDGRALGRAFQMPPQLFQNDGSGGFVESPAEAVGAYFEEAYLGRSVARIDWNCDGRDDLVVSHLDAPAALLTNTSETTAQSLRVRLFGVHSERGAIGAAATVSWPAGQSQRHLLAGDGYQACNERMLTFAVPPGVESVTLSIRWPSGLTQQIQNVPCGCEFGIVEGGDRALLFRRF